MYVCICMYIHIYICFLFIYLYAHTHVYANVFLFIDLPALTKRLIRNPSKGDIAIINFALQPTSHFGRNLSNHFFFPFEFQ